MKKPLFRFKTKEEFIQEFGRIWREKLGYGWAIGGEMDYLFGATIKAKSNKDFLKLYIGLIDRTNYDYWTISREMIKPIKND